MIAIIRPDAWDFPLLLHVLGAMLLVGTLVLAASALFLAWRDGNAALMRLGYRSLLLGVLPAWIVMRGSGQWIAYKEHLTDSNASWIGIGFTTARRRPAADSDLDPARRTRRAARRPRPGLERLRPHVDGPGLGALDRLPGDGLGDDHQAGLSQLSR